MALVSRKTSGSIERATERLCVDADGKNPEAKLASVDMNAVALRRDAEDTENRRSEVTAVRVGVKAHEVGTEQPLEDLDAPRQLRINSDAGNGMWRKNPMRALGMRARKSCGTSSSW